jgi:hypothetical protein
VALVAGAGAMAAWWVRWERSRLEPLVDLAVSTSRPVLIAHLGGVMVGCATFAQFISSFTLVSLPVGHGLGRSLAVAGLVQLPGAAVLFGRRAPRHPHQRHPRFLRPAAGRRGADRRRLRPCVRPARLGRRDRAASWW